MKVERDLNRFKRLYPDKKAVISKDHSSEVDYTIYSSAGTFNIKKKRNEQ
jgi:hypothetical protein